MDEGLIARGALGVVLGVGDEGHAQIVLKAAVVVELRWCEHEGQEGRAVGHRVHSFHDDFHVEGLGERTRRQAVELSARANSAEAVDAPFAAEDDGVGDVLPLVVAEGPPGEALDRLGAEGAGGEHI